MATNGDTRPAEPGARSYDAEVQEGVSEKAEEKQAQNGQSEAAGDAKATLSDSAAPPEPVEEALKQTETPNKEPETNGEVLPLEKSHAEAVSQPGPPPLPEDTDEEIGEADDTPTATVQPPTPGEYTGAGLDESPRTPLRFSHRRVGSRGSNRANGRPTRASSSESSIVSQNELNLVYEKYSDGEGGRLISVRQPPEYEQNLKLDEKEKRPNAGVQSKGELELVSGRQAAAGWDRSR